MRVDRRACSASLLAALGLLSSACAVQAPDRQPYPSATPPMEILRLSSPGAVFAPVPLRIQPIEPTRASLGAPVAATPPAAGFTHLFGGLDCASRGAVTASPGTWAVTVTAPLQPEFEVFGLVATAQRVLVIGRVHELFDGEGRSLFWALTGASLPGLFPEANAILAVDANGGLLRRSLVTGEVEFKCLVFGGDEYHYTFVGLRGNSYVVAGSERALDPHGAYRPTLTIAQRLSVEAPFTIDPSSRLLLRAGGGEQLRVAALGLVLTLPGLVLASDFNLVPSAAFASDFVPLAASLGPDGALHLLVWAARGVRYWRVEGDGRRTRELALTDQLPERPVPPILGYDGRVFVQSRRMLTVVETDGTTRSSVILRSPHARAVAQPDGTLLVADGAVVWHLDTSLRATALANLPGEELRSPAVAVSANRLYVASGARLLRLDRRP
jgi:hypothetical protein